MFTSRYSWNIAKGGVKHQSMNQSFVYFSTIASFKENLNESKENVKTDYCNKVFGGWDYALDDAITCHAKTKSIYKEFVVSKIYHHASFCFVIEIIGMSRDRSLLFR